MPRRVLPLLVVLVLSGCAPGPEAHWTPQTITVDRIDYTGWDAVLREHVRDGAVDYAEISRDARFEAFVKDVNRSRFTKETTREERLAFLLNGYNALVVQSVIEGGSPASVLGRRRFFRRTPHAIAGQSITLADLVNRRIRRYDEPRVHFALVCGAVSCPPLRSEAYRPERLDAQLEDAARAFVNDPTRNRFDAGRRRADVSKLFDWYAEDFTAAHGTLQAYLSRTVDDPGAAAGLAAGGWRLRFLPWSWRLNGAPPLEAVQR